MPEKQNNKVLIIDCDGVLYPIAELNLFGIINAMKKVYRDNVKVLPKEQQTISERTIAENHEGAFNYIKEICKCKNYDFSLFCQQMADATDYSRITENMPLYAMLKQAQKKQKVIIFSNNSRAHIDKVTRQLFHKSADELEQRGILICDITFTEKGGYFYPKQSPDGFKNFLQKIGAKAEDCTLLDDTQRNIDCAQKQGINGVLISQDFTLADFLKKQNNVKDFEYERISRSL